MNTTRVVVMVGAVLSLALNVVGGARAGLCSFPKEDTRLEGRLNFPRIHEHGGPVSLQLSVVTPDRCDPVRIPKNLAIVLDRSGSMGSEQKIEYARASVRALVDRLRSDDILSIVIYDDLVEVLRPASRVGDKEAIKRLIDEVAPGGWTNLGGGLVEGFRQVKRFCSETYANRVVLISDGLANRGITDRRRLEKITRRYRSESISLTTVGVGLDYNENLMVGLAESGGGNYYFVEHARDLASMFRSEFDAMQSLVAQNARIEIRLGHGVTLVDVVGCEFSREGGRTFLSLGDLYSSERRELTVCLNIPAGEGSSTIATAVLRYSTEGRAGIASNTVSVGIRYTRERAEVDRHRDWDIEAKSQVALSTRRVEEALEALDRGEKGAAIETLQEAQKELAASPAAARDPEAALLIRDQVARVQSFSQALAGSDSSLLRAKKSIQFENYRTQKKR